MSLITEKVDLDNILLTESTISANTVINQSLLTNIANNSAHLTKVFCNITRPNNVTAYGANNIINALVGSINLPFFDFTGHDGQLFIMQSITMIVGDDSASTLLPIRCSFYDTPTLASQNLGDNQAVTISLADILSHNLCLASISSANLQKVSTLCYMDQFQNKQFIIPTGGKVYMGLATQSAFTPIALESITFQLLGIFTTPV